MTDEHTPTPWHVDAFGCHNDYKLRLCEPMRAGFPLATIAQFQYNWRDAKQYERQISYKEAEANARRAAACVNALSGISTQAIEAGVVAELTDLLIEADKVIVWEGHGLGRDFSDKVEAAIAKARGQSEVQS